MSPRQQDDLSIKELETQLYRKKRELRQNRLRRLKKAGRVVEVAGFPPPNPVPPPLLHPEMSAAGAMRQYVVEDVDNAGIYAPALPSFQQPIPLTSPKTGINWRWLANKSLLLVEFAALLAFALVIISFLDTRAELNQELSKVQAAESVAIALPTPTATPVIGVVVLPSGHKPPVEGQPLEPGEAGYVPEHLLPIINSYVPPPAPTPGPEQARRLQIPAINVDKPIVQGDDWEQLKKGVGQHIGPTLPGQDGNLVLSAHNDIYGEIFRHLDKLKPGDEIIISTERRAYTYVVREIQVVDPTDVWVMGQTDHAGTTLISCYPYLVNDHRIVIFADLADSS